MGYGRARHVRKRWAKLEKRMMVELKDVKRLRLERYRQGYI